jgi:acetylornithine deacetylase/succinyl-diaminopimelate desuccinylase-like protein
VNKIGLAPALMADLERETSELLSELIQIDTSNPPGNETAVAEFMAAWFRRHGLQGEVVGEPAGRASFILRLEGRGPGPTLLLLAHEDVVPANAADWQVPPFSGLVKDGYVWGRGALDIKNLVAANAVAVRRLAAAGTPFYGTVVYACTADEESCTGGGVRWLLEHRPDLVRCDYVLNEGDGAFIPCGDRRLFMVQSGEKGAAQFRLVVHGRAGHGSVPLRGGNAVLAAAQIVEALSAHELPVVVDDSSRDLVEYLVEDPGLRARLRDSTRARTALAELADRDPSLVNMIEPLYGFAFSPTMVQSNSGAVNVFPTEVVLSVDCRMLAGHDEGEVEAEVRAALDGVDARWDLEWINVVRGNSSPYPTPLSEAIRTVLHRHVPDAELGNTHCVGFTDSRWFRAAHPECVAYNFDPHVEESYADVWARAHNVDERIMIRDLAFEAFFAEQVALELLQRPL